MVVVVAVGAAAALVINQNQLRERVAFCHSNPKDSSRVGSNLGRELDNSCIG